MALDGSLLHFNLVNLPVAGKFTRMIHRKRLKSVMQGLNTRPAVVLLGPRQVGKTTLAFAMVEEVDAVYLDLESPADQRQISDPEFFFEQNNTRLVVIDEVQKAPALFEILRSQIDKNRRQGRKNSQFLLLGSASNDLLQQSSESLAGRVSYQELSPLTLDESDELVLEQLWVNGGFPESYLQKDISIDWRQDFIRTYLERDIPALGVRIPAETLRRFWTMLAHHQSQLFNASQIGGSLGVKGQTAARYLDLLVDLMLVRRLPPWSSNVGKRLVKSPKVYIRDSGVLHALLGIGTLNELLAHPINGASWEGFVIENIMSCLPSTASAFFYRTQAGAEIDLLLNIGQETWAIEIKRSLAPTVSRGFYSACEDLGLIHRFLVYPGADTYKLKDSITVVSLGDIMRRVNES